MIRDIATGLLFAVFLFFGHLYKEARIELEELRQDNKSPRQVLTKMDSVNQQNQLVNRFEKERNNYLLKLKTKWKSGKKH